jgi:hypothetical protein
MSMGAFTEAPGVDSLSVSFTYVIIFSISCYPFLSVYFSDCFLIRVFKLGINVAVRGHAVYLYRYT